MILKDSEGRMRYGRQAGLFGQEVGATVGGTCRTCTMVGCVVRAWLRGSALERLGRLWICLEVECFIHAKLDPLSTGAGTSIVSVSSTSLPRAGSTNHPRAALLVAGQPNGRSRQRLAGAAYGCKRAPTIARHGASDTHHSTASHRHCCVRRVQHGWERKA